jgi:hypothetical protein
MTKFGQMTKDPLAKGPITGILLTDSVKLTQGRKASYEGRKMATPSGV